MTPFTRHADAQVRIARAFSRAAASYDQAATLQRQVAERLLQGLPASVTGPILDLGAGTGVYAQTLGQRYPEAPLLLLDLAPGMLQFARQRLGARAVYLQGDAEQLPLADQSLELVFSSLAIQWCREFSRVLAELKRVLRPGGHALLATLAAGSMPELARAWQAVDAEPHHNRYPAAEQQRAQAEASGLQLIDWQVAPVRLFYPDLRALTAELKSLGVNTVLGRPRPHLNRRALARLTAAYEQMRTPAGLPLSYQVIWTHLQAPSA